MRDQQPVVVALDLGGTTIKGAVLDSSYAVLAERNVPTQADRGPEAVLARLRATARELADLAQSAHRLAAAAIVVPGTVDSRTGIAIGATNIGWHNVPLGALLADDLRVPVAVDHDVRAAGLAEATFGLGVDGRDFSLIAIGTGIAAAIVLRDEVYPGMHCSAGEIGHVSVHPFGRRCGCGRRGCLEAYSSAAAISTEYASRTGIVLTAAEVAQLIAVDQTAAAVWQQAAATLGRALATYVSLLDPSRIVLGGGLAQAGEALRGPVSHEMGSILGGQQAPPIELSNLGVAAARLGAAIFAWRAAGAEGSGRPDSPAGIEIADGMVQ